MATHIEEKIFLVQVPVMHINNSLAQSVLAFTGMKKSNEKLCHRPYHSEKKTQSNKLYIIYTLNGLDDNKRKNTHITVQQFKCQSTSIKHGRFSEICA